MPESNDPSRTSTDDADMVAHLIRAAGRRIEPPTVAHARVLSAATASWQQKVQRRRLLRISAVAAASIAVVTATLALLVNLQHTPMALVGHIDRVLGECEIGHDDNRATPCAGAQELRAGQQIRTHGDGRVGIQLLEDVSLRLADRTEVVLESAARVRVLSGKIYIDTGVSAPNPRPRIEVVTPAGVAADYGTQFEVRYVEGALRVRVREGRVSIDPDDAASLGAVAGDEVTIRAGMVERQRIAATDAQWQWVQSIAPKPHVDGRPVSFLLAWVARETGKQVRFAEPALARRADTTILHGDIGDLAPLDALALMLATTDLEHTILDDGTILIRLRDGEQQ